MPHLAPAKRKKFETYLRMIGCTLKRIKGDHFIYTRPGLKRPVVITQDTDVPVFIIRNNLRTLGISIEEFLSAFNQL